MPAALSLWTVLLLLAPATGSAAGKGVEFRDGDRVVLIGGTLIEREQRYGYWEYALTIAHPDQQITFRNLGWSGDTVWAESRGIFDPPEKGYERLIAQVRELRPTVLILNYGNNEAWAGPTGLERFLAQYRRLIGDLTAAAASDAPTSAGQAVRVVLLGPLPMEAGVGPNPNPSDYNANIQTYSAAIAQLALEVGATFVPLLDLSAAAGATGGDSSPPLTDNGLHLSEEGYWRTAGAVCQKLCGRTVAAERLPPRSPPSADEQPSRQAAWELLQTIRRKNELYFHRWRPQNVTYLFLFRKHEQGQNAVEIPQFDPLIAAAEARIADLRRLPQPR